MSIVNTKKGVKKGINIGFIISNIQNPVFYYQQLIFELSILS